RIRFSITYTRISNSSGMRTIPALKRRLRYKRDEGRRIAMTVTMIDAVAANGAIGRDNELLWRLPADMAYFKRQTLGKTVLMGRKTFESLGRPLKDRRNVVLSRTLTAAPDGCELVGSIDEALRQYRDE